MKKVLLVVLVVCATFISGCTDEESSRRALHAQGFTDISFTGWSPLVCSDSDTFSTGFSAKNPNGQYVNGTVCCGLLTKGCTIRY